MKYNIPHSGHTSSRSAADQVNSTTPKTMDKIITESKPGVKGPSSRSVVVAQKKVSSFFQLKSKEEKANIIPSELVQKQQLRGEPARQADMIDNKEGLNGVNSIHAKTLQRKQSEVKNDNPIIVQCKDDEPLSDPENEKVVKIVNQMGINPKNITLRKWSNAESQCVGSTIYISSSLLNDSEEKLSFVLGHELSHYITSDNNILGLSNLLVGALGGLVQYLNVGWFGGLLGTLGTGLLSIYSGAGPLNALAHAISAGSTIILVKLLDIIGYGYLANPLAMALAMMAVNTIPKVLEGLVKNKDRFIPLLKIFTPETLSQLIIEAKADIHSAIKLGAAKGGIEHFKDAMKENDTEVIGMPKGNSLVDPYHPPLSLRITYLQKLVGL